MKLYHVAAISENHVIGNNGKIPWRVNGDLPRFREITMGHPVIMGRLTFESMGPYAPLKGRLNIVLTTRKSIQVGNVTVGSGVVVTLDDGTEVGVVSSVGEALRLCKDQKSQEVYIIGGGFVYEQTMDIVDELRITLVHREVTGDIFYPEIDDETWAMSYCKSDHETHTYIDYVRRELRDQ